MWSLYFVFSVSQTSGLGSGSTFYSGNTVIMFTATDNRGASTQCSITVRVSGNNNNAVSGVQIAIFDTL